MNRRSFLRSAASAGAVAAVPLTALVARAQEPSHQGGIRRGHTAGYGPLFPTRDRSTGRRRCLQMPRRQTKPRSPSATQANTTSSANLRSNSKGSSTSVPQQG
jgi:hypothetical protein